MLTDYELFLNGCYSAIVEIKYENNDLYDFIDLMKKLGLGKYSEWLEKIDDKCSILCSAKHEGIKHLCFEYQMGKGFTYGDKEDYIKNCEETKVLTLEDLKKSTGYYERYTNCELSNEFSILNEFCCWYGWQPIIYVDKNEYNILDTQLDNLLVEEENFKTFNELLNRILYRAIDYFMDETEIESKEDINYGYSLLNIAKIWSEEKEYKYFEDYLKEMESEI